MCPRRNWSNLKNSLTSLHVRVCVLLRVLPCPCFQQDKYVFPPAGAGGRLATPSHKLNKTFKFRDYAPKVFKKLRGTFGIDEVSQRQVDGR